MKKNNKPLLLKLDRALLNQIVNGRLADWIKISKRREISDYQHYYQSAYNELRDHHEKETTFLINLCKSMATKLIEIDKLLNE